MRCNHGAAPWDHPRVCGEHVAKGVGSAVKVGSSPRMRGAHVGRGTEARIGGDHPRVCGEHKQAWSKDATGTGSSPRMRGALNLIMLHSITTRIIPAYAGSTKRLRRFRLLVRDHPRVCGEHVIKPWHFVYCAGSSPRMRGALRISLAFFSSSRIIPAYAGSTSSFSFFLSCSGDHPRVCGEHHLLACLFVVGEGSSPRMRGAPCKSFAHMRTVGIIPAYAGSTEFIVQMHDTS